MCYTVPTKSKSRYRNLQYLEQMLQYSIYVIVQYVTKPDISRCILSIRFYAETSFLLGQCRYEKATRSYCFCSLIVCIVQYMYSRCVGTILALVYCTYSLSKF